MRRPAILGSVLCAVLAAPVYAAPADPPAAPPVPPAPIAPATRFAAPPGWAEDDQGAALAAFLRSCGAGPAAGPNLGIGLGLGPACRAASRLRSRGPAAARRFFARWFDPVRVPRPDGSDGFLTGYYEPEVAAARAPTETLRAPLLARPPNLVVIERGERPAGWPEGLTAAIRIPAGFTPLPDRAGIEEGQLGDAAQPIAWLDPVDAFMVHVQGSARLRIGGGGRLRVGFDGRNGHPYSAIARILADREGVPPSEMTADRLVAWLRAHPDEAAGLMRQNRSYIFFRVLPAARPGEGPVGAAGVPLLAGRSLAVDPGSTPFGTPVWLEGELPKPGDTPVPDGGRATLRRLVVAQDAGAAIRGPARGDLFLGSGEAAGAVASLLRHPVAWTELRPRASPRPASLPP